MRRKLIIVNPALGGSDQPRDLLARWDARRPESTRCASSALKIRSTPASEGLCGEGNYPGIKTYFTSAISTAGGLVSTTGEVSLV